MGESARQRVYSLQLSELEMDVLLNGMRLCLGTDEGLTTGDRAVIRGLLLKAGEAKEIVRHAQNTENTEPIVASSP